MMENSEEILLELEEYNRGDDTGGGGGDIKPLSSTLENYIENVARNGIYIFPWQKIRKLYLNKLRSVLNDLNSIFLKQSGTPQQQHYFTSIPAAAAASSSSPPPSNAAAIDHRPINEEMSVLKERIIERMTSFNNAPFTIQRISELLIKPNVHYSRADKFLRGLEKCVLVVTTVDPFGNKIFVENGSSTAMEELALSSRSPSPSITPKKPSTLSPASFESSIACLDQTPVPPAAPTSNTLTTSINEDQQAQKSESAPSFSLSLSSTETTATIVETAAGAAAATTVEAVAVNVAVVVKSGQEQQQINILDENNSTSTATTETVIKSEEATANDGGCKDQAMIVTGEICSMETNSIKITEAAESTSTEAAITTTTLTTTTIKSNGILKAADEISQINKNNCTTDCSDADSAQIQITQNGDGHQNSAAPTTTTIITTSES